MPHFCFCARYFTSWNHFLSTSPLPRSTWHVLTYMIMIKVNPKFYREEKTFRRHWTMDFTWLWPQICIIRISCLGLGGLRVSYRWSSCTWRSWGWLQGRLLPQNNIRDGLFLWNKHSAHTQQVCWTFLQPDTHSLRTSPHFKVAFYCNQPQAHLCTNHVLQHLDMPHLSCGWIILAKARGSTNMDC